MQTEEARRGSPGKTPFWRLKLWSGMRTGPLVSLLWANHLAVAPERLPLVLLVLCTSLFNSAYALAQTLLLGPRIRATALDPAPIFIIGHFRTGTTHLHTLLSLDGRWAAPSTYACFAPDHFLVTRRWLAPLLRRLLPRYRPMDRVEVRFHRPQEEEIALLAMGAPTIFRGIAFLRRPMPDLWTLDLEGAPAGALARFERAYLRFLQAVTLQAKKPLLLKSPANTGRIPWLLKHFPEARFIYLSREPEAVLRSTRHFWKAMALDHGFQGVAGDPAAQNRAIAAIFDRMMAGLERGRAALAGTGRIVDLRYEDLVVQPMAELDRLYGWLGLAMPAATRSAVRRHLDSLGPYRTNDLTTQPPFAPRPQSFEAYRAAHRTGTPTPGGAGA